MKQFIWNLMGTWGQKQYKQFQMCFSSDYKCFKKRKKGEKAYLLLDTPRHGNLGDQAIAIAEIDFITRHFPGAALLELSYDECKYNMDKIYHYISVKDDTIILPGGGFIGTLWIHEHENFIQILTKLHNCKIVVFPQTIYFENSEKGQKLAVEFQQCLLKCRDITIFTRDQKSFQWLDERVRNCQNVKYELVPDIVMSMQFKSNYINRKKEVLFCFRGDLEKCTTAYNLAEVSGWLKNHGYQVSKTDTVINRIVPMQKRREFVQKKLQQFADSSLVITDRLHGMIFAAITATPCIALNNVSGKVQGGYQWLKNLSYIIYVDDSNIDIKFLKDLLSADSIMYDPEDVWNGSVEKLIGALDPQE